MNKNRWTRPLSTGGACVSSGGRSCLAPVWWEEGSGSRGCHGVSTPDGGVCLGNPALSLLFRWRHALGLASASPADPGLFLGCSHTPWLLAEVSLETRPADVVPALTQLGAGEFPFPSPRVAQGSCFFPPKQRGPVAGQGNDEVSPGSRWQLCHLPGTRGPWGQPPVLPAAPGAWVFWQGGCHPCP